MGTTELRNVELVSVGTWGASTGATTITEDDFASIVAAYNDHVVDRPMVKLGHEDDNAMNAQLGDGEPAFGWIENVAVGDGSQDRPNKTSLYGDLVGMPAKLAEIVPTAFRRRSVEIAWGVKTYAGKSYSAVLEAVSLLGAKRPAVKGLADLLALYSDNTQIAAADRQTAIEISDKANDTGTVHPQQAAAGDGGDVGKPTTQTKETPMSKLTKKAVADALAKLADVKDDDELTDEQLKALGLTAPVVVVPDDAAAKAASEAEAKKVADEAAAAAIAEAEARTAASAGTPETVTITKSMFAEFEASSKLAQATAAEIAKTRRDGLVKTAFSEGRITKEEQKDWREALDENEAGTTKLLSKLSARFSTTEVGADHAPTAEFSDGESAAVTAFLDDFKKNFG